jgi:outer membrane protein OmpA-like peptidoglycan-associated protein
MNGQSVAVSLEGGIPFALGWQGVSIEPQAQLVWQHLSFAKRSDIDGIDLDLGNPDQVTGRFGFRLLRPFQNEDGTRFTPYLKANLLQSLTGSGKVVLSGVGFGTGQAGTAVQVGGGVTGTLTPNLSVYGDVAWQSDVGGNGGFRGWVFNAGLRFVFGNPAPVLGAATPAPVATPARSYLVFFDWDKSDLTARARQIIAEAAQNVGRVEVTRIEVSGHADRTGSAPYNQALSERRAGNVAAELVRDGVPQNIITVEGFGYSRPLVPTAAGVREPQNRRVEIVLR